MYFSATPQLFIFTKKKKAALFNLHISPLITLNVVFMDMDMDVTQHLSGRSPRSEAEQSNGRGWEGQNWTLVLE